MYLWEKNEYVATHTQKLCTGLFITSLKKKVPNWEQTKCPEREQIPKWSPSHRMKSNSGIEMNALLTYRTARMKHETPH